MTPKQQGTTETDQSPLRPTPTQPQSSLWNPWHALQRTSRPLLHAPVPGLTLHPHTPSREFPRQQFHQEMSSVHSFSEQMLDEHLSCARWAKPSAGEGRVNISQLGSPRAFHNPVARSICVSRNSSPTKLWLCDLGPVTCPLWTSGCSERVRQHL